MLSLLCGLLVLCAVSLHAAEERFMRYRLLAPETPSTAVVRIHSHATANGYTPTWGGDGNPALPGYISNGGLYVQPDEWSDWKRLPDQPVWGDVRLCLTGADPLTRCRVEVQVSPRPDPALAVRTFTIESTTGGTVGFTLPGGSVLEANMIESMPEGMLRRRRVADEMPIPEDRRLKLIRFSPYNVAGDSSIAGSEEFELETARRLGFNTFEKDWPGALYTSLVGSFVTPEWAAKQDIPPAQQQRIAYVILADEPNWQFGFDQMWAKTGEEGFHAYLQQNGVTPEQLGVRSLEEVHHIRRNQPVPADAPLPRRRLWYWSCRYTFAMSSEHWAEVTRTLRRKFPDAHTMINYSDHAMGMIGGALGLPVDIFEDGRRNAVYTHWTEDWMANAFNTWGDGLFQKVAYFGDILRGAARYQGITSTSMGYYVVGNGFDPLGEGIDRTVGVRVNLLLGQGCKTFNHFNYGPTSMGTVDYWADCAPFARGVADTIRMLGGKNIEPYLWEGQAVNPETCIIYSVDNFYWLEANKTQDDEYERQKLYCMLQQEQIPVDIIAGQDLQRFIRQYKAAYVVDRNLVAASAQALKAWVEAGGTLVLWPGAAAYDEYNEPLAVFPAEPGQYRVGNGWIVRMKEREGTLWRDRSVELSAANRTRWPSVFDDEHRKIACRPALELARITRPVTASFPGIVADPLVSDRGVAVPLVNMQGTFDKGGTQYLTVKITLADGAGITRAWSSRQGALPLKHEGNAVSVVMPLLSTDILIFSRETE